MKVFLNFEQILLHNIIYSDRNDLAGFSISVFEAIDAKHPRKPHAR